MSSMLKDQVVQSGTVKNCASFITQFLTAAVAALVFTVAGVFGAAVARAQEWPLPNPPVVSSQLPPREHVELRGRSQLGADVLANALKPTTKAENVEAVSEATSTTTTPTTLNYHYGLAVDTAGNIYVANLFGNNVTVYNKSLTLIGTITQGMSFPAAVAVAFGGNIYVANNGGNNITIYNPQYEQIGTITDPTLVNPASMYIDGDNNIWVLDALATVHLYLDNGTPISRQALSGGTAIGPWGSNVSVWGAPSANGTVEYVQNAGEAVHGGVAFPLEYPESPVAGGEAQDAQGNQYVTAPESNAVEFFTANGGGFGTILTTPGPGYGIAVDPLNNRIYVALTTLNKIYSYSLTTHNHLGTIH